MVQAAIDHGGIGWTTLDVWRRLRLRELVLWTASRDHEILGCVVTGFEPRPQCNLMVVFFIGGRDFKAWHACEHLLIEWARKHDCPVIQGYGRLGWPKLVPDGWEASQIVMRKVLDP